MLDSYVRRGAHHLTHSTYPLRPRGGGLDSEEGSSFPSLTALLGVQLRLLPIGAAKTQTDKESTKSGVEAKSGLRLMYTDLVP